jgi:hypothetical protein
MEWNVFALDGGVDRALTPLLSISLSLARHN